MNILKWLHRFLETEDQRLIEDFHALQGKFGALNGSGVDERALAVAKTKLDEVEHWLAAAMAPKADGAMAAASTPVPPLNPYPGDVITVIAADPPTAATAQVEVPENVTVVTPS